MQDVIETPSRQDDRGPELPEDAVSRESGRADESPIVHRSPSGRTVVLEMQRRAEGADELTVYGRAGAVELSVRFTDQGPVLSFVGARIQLDATESVKIACQDFSVDARRSVHVSSGGELVQESAGEMRVEAKKDLWLDGQMVLVNCDRERELEERAARAHPCECK